MHKDKVVEQEAQLEQAEKLINSVLDGEELLAPVNDLGHSEEEVKKYPRKKGEANGYLHHNGVVLGGRVQKSRAERAQIRSIHKGKGGLNFATVTSQRPSSPQRTQGIRLHRYKCQNLDRQYWQIAQRRKALSTTQ